MTKKIIGFFALVFLISMGQARANQAQDEQAIKALNNTFAEAFVKRDAKLRASVFADDATLLTPQAVWLMGRPAMVKDFGPEAKAYGTKNTKLTFSNYRFRFITPDLAFVDSLLTINNIIGPGGKVLDVAHVSITQEAIRRGDRWFILDERSHFLPPSFHASEGPQ